MCLQEVTTKFRKHKVGYKIFLCKSLKQNRNSKPCFISPFKRFDVPFGTWVDCRDFYEATEREEKEFGYYPGWHYYLTKKEALKNVNYHSYIIKISVKDVICIGSTSSEWDAGVAYKIKLDKIVYRKKIHKELSERQRDLAELKSLEKLPAKLKKIFKIFDFNKAPTKELANKFANSLDSLDTYAEIVTVIDSFSRYGVLFKYFTFLHQCLLSDIYLNKTDTGARYTEMFNALIKKGVHKIIVTKGNKMYIIDK